MQGLQTKCRSVKYEKYNIQNHVQYKFPSLYNCTTRVDTSNSHSQVYGTYPQWVWASRETSSWPHWCNSRGTPSPHGCWCHQKICDYLLILLWYRQISCSLEMTSFLTGLKKINVINEFSTLISTWISKKCELNQSVDSMSTKFFVCNRKEKGQYKHLSSNHYSIQNSEMICCLLFNTHLWRKSLSPSLISVFSF